MTDNQLKNVAVPYLTLGYDALSRLRYDTHGSTVTNYVSDGTDIVAEYDNAGALLARFAFGGMGEPLVAYDATGTRSWMQSDERGSVVALANDSAAMTAINSYDEYGVPGASNAGAFQYAGQYWMSRPGLYYSVFRAYGQQLGRFMQTDPIGYGGGTNLYVYVGNDPVNYVDPFGLVESEIIVTGHRCYHWLDFSDGSYVCADNFYLVNRMLFGLNDTFGGLIGRGGGIGVGFGRGGGGGGTNASQSTSGSCSRSFLASAAGKWNARGTTALGLIYGIASNVAGQIVGTHPRIEFGNNAVQFTGSPINIGGRAVTLGNVQIYGSEGPSASVFTYSGVGRVNLGRHEEAHTLQAEALGNAYIGTQLAGGVGQASNPMEQAADRYARGETCSAF